MRMDTRQAQRYMGMISVLWFICFSFNNASAAQKNKAPRTIKISTKQTLLAHGLTIRVERVRDSLRHYREPSERIAVFKGSRRVPFPKELRENLTVGVYSFPEHHSLETEKAFWVLDESSGSGGNTEFSVFLIKRSRKKTWIKKLGSWTDGKPHEPVGPKKLASQIRVRDTACCSKWSYPSLMAIPDEWGQLKILDEDTAGTQPTKPTPGDLALLLARKDQPEPKEAPKTGEVPTKAYESAVLEAFTDLIYSGRATEAWSFLGKAYNSSVGEEILFQIGSDELLNVGAPSLQQAESLLLGALTESPYLSALVRRNRGNLVSGWSQKSD